MKKKVDFISNKVLTILLIGSIKKLNKNKIMSIPRFQTFFSNNVKI